WKIRESIQNVMWDYVGIVRTTEGLQTAKEELEMIENKIKTFNFTVEKVEIEHILIAAKLVTEDALFHNKESVGAHFMGDLDGGILMERVSKDKRRRDIPCQTSDILHRKRRVLLELANFIQRAAPPALVGFFNLPFNKTSVFISVFFDIFNSKYSFRQVKKAGFCFVNGSDGGANVETVKIVHEIQGILKNDYPRAMSTFDKLAVLSERIKKENILVYLPDLPVVDLNTTRRIELYIRMSDDLETLTLYKVLDNSGVHGKDGSLDYSKLKLEFVAKIPSSRLMFPDNYIAKHFSGELLTRILTLYTRGRRYTEFMNTITNHDNSIDLDVWARNIDTAYLQKVSKEKGILDRADIKVALDVGTGEGGIATACVDNIKSLKTIMVTDISVYALMSAKRNILPRLKNNGISIEPYLGKGIKRIPSKVDVMFINPPYIRIPSWEVNKHTAIDDPYKGTGLIREIIKEGIYHLNPNNPDASIIMNYSSLAEVDVKKYLSDYAANIKVEILSEGFEVPLKIERVDERWVDWMKGSGLIVKENVPYDGFKYWHTLNVMQIKPKKFENNDQYLGDGGRLFIMNNIKSVLIQAQNIKVLGKLFPSCLKA
ncbi:MAG: methyltransferase, partial [Candidatus Omnitrophica bacterium]|nr:methyltransferase [Candidatus Omnitrophota bacterium]